MRTFLLTWNPRRWTWATLSKAAAAVSAGRPVVTRWSCGNRKDVAPGDRLFLLRQRLIPRGIIGSGWAVSRVWQGRHWDHQRAVEGDVANYVRLRFDTLLDPDLEDVLPVTSRRTGDLNRVNWRSQASGILIEPGAAKELEVLWTAHTSRSAAFDDEVAFLEGEVRRRLTAHRRRERALRDLKIRAVLRATGGRLVCQVPGCGFDFLAVYGEPGRGYAQVHHLDPLSRASQPVRTSLSRLGVVCANCHAMIHRGGACRPIDSLIPEARKTSASAQRGGFRRLGR